MLCDQTLFDILIIAVINPAPMQVVQKIPDVFSPAGSILMVIGMFEHVTRDKRNTTPNGPILARILGEYDWHKHSTADETFVVLSGAMVVELRDRKVGLGPGELYVVPRGVEHRPVAVEETSIVVIEPSGVGGRGD